MSARSEQRAKEILDGTAALLWIIGVLTIVLTTVAFVAGLLIQLWLTYVFGETLMPHWIVVWMVVAATGWFIGWGIFALGKALEE